LRAAHRWRADETDLQDDDAAAYLDGRPTRHAIAARVRISRKT
jgi:hypothetical protein